MMTKRQTLMRPREWLDFVRDRVLAEVRDNPPTMPLLTETGPRVPKAVCKRGHPKAAPGDCVECHRLRLQRLRAQVRHGGTERQS